MSVNNTTLSGAISSVGQTSFGVASATGITAPVSTTGSGFTYLLVDQEFMFVTGVNGTTVTVLRAQLGTSATTHLSGALVQAGLPSDFTTPFEIVGQSLATKQTEAGINWPATFLTGSADAIPAGVAGNYIVKTAGVDAMTLAAPTAAQEGNVISIFSDTANAHTITATSLFANGTALKTTATFPAFRGAGIMLKVVNGVYHVLSNASAGQVVFT